MDDIDSTISEIGRGSLACMEKVAATAACDLGSMPIDIRQSLASFNNLTGTDLVNEFANTQTETLYALDALMKEPIIARVTYIDEDYEDDREQVVYITRTKTPSTTAPFKVASYRSPIGKLASAEPGDIVYLRLGSRDAEVHITSSTKLAPIRTDQTPWDSVNSVIDVESVGIYTVKSLRFFTTVREPEASVDLSSAWEDEPSAADRGYVEGIRHAIRTQMSLRDQAVLDAQQDEVFRQPLDSRLFLSGPPGSGKTTTLIRRLGQKTDLVVMQESLDELRKLQIVERETQKPHATNWVLFSPSDLLRHYVKEAFAREGHPATDKHIRLWADYRRELARDTLRLLRTGERRGSFTLRNASLTLTDSAIDSVRWYQAFRTYVLKSIHESMVSFAEQMADSSDPEIAKLGNRIFDIVYASGDQESINTISDLVPLTSEVSALAKRKNDEIGTVIATIENRALHDDRAFPDDLIRKIIEIRTARASLEQPNVDDSDLEDEDDDDDFEESASLAISRRAAQRVYHQALRAMGRAKARGRNLPQTSTAGRLIEWLAPARKPTQSELASLARLTQERVWLRRFADLERLFLRGIPAIYKRFRKEVAEAKIWYASPPEKADSIIPRELDLLILAMFRAADDIMAAYGRYPAMEAPGGEIVGTIRRLRYAQIFVDEATDFSAVELACMYALCHPSLKSFFLCGDLKQRLTITGIRDSGAMDWVCPGIMRRTISISYRQSRLLVDLARTIATLDGSTPDEITLPKGHRNDGVAPVWRENLGDNERAAAWLTERITEIERMISLAPTIAVMVDCEERVEPLAKALNRRLENINLTAEACREGQFLGNDRSVRVFDIKHIKGLEFEAAFFVGLDATISRLPDLYAKYLYVGATRASTYVGVTFDGKRPTALDPLAGHFKEDWSKPH